MTDLDSFSAPLKIILIGATGGIGKALLERLCNDPNVEAIYAMSRRQPHLDHPKVKSLHIDISNENNIQKTALELEPLGPFDMVLMTTGLLHNENIGPEKSTRDMSLAAFQESFMINSIGPALTAKHFLPLLRRDSKSVFAALSARVGSISDNRLGGWYAYRAAKAALNMILKTLSIEYARKRKHMVILGLHPGTVDTDLSKPFQGNVPDGKLFTADYCAERLLNVINDATPQRTGSLLAWDGKTVPF